MNKHKFLPFVICVTVLLVLFAQESLLANSPLFLDIEKEGRSCGIKDYNAEQSSLVLYLRGDAITPVLTSIQYLDAFFAIAEPPVRSTISPSLICKFFNHSPPSFL